MTLRERRARPLEARRLAPSAWLVQRSAFEVLHDRLEVVEPGDFLVELAAFGKPWRSRLPSRRWSWQAPPCRDPRSRRRRSASTVRPFADTSARPPSTTIFSCLPPENTVMMPGRMRRHHRRVTGEHAEIAFGARDVDLIDLAGEHELLGRHEIELEGGHVCLLPDLLILKSAERASRRMRSVARLALRDAGLAAGSSG